MQVGDAYVGTNSLNNEMIDNLPYQMLMVDMTTLKSPIRINLMYLFLVRRKRFQILFMQLTPSVDDGCDLVKISYPNI